MPERPLAVLCSDIHLTSTPPTARSAEPNWLEAQLRPVRQLAGLAKDYGVPVVCAGDIFDRWLATPELINWAIANLPTLYAVPGQHDLPYHNYEDRTKSAYWTLVLCGKVRHLDPSRPPVEIGEQLVLHPFPWGYPLQPVVRDPADGNIHLAVVHEYIWREGYGYPGSPPEALASRRRRQLAGYDAAVFGDNHQGFSLRVGACNVLNCGAFQRRKSDERGYRPQVGVLYSDGAVTTVQLDTAEECWLEPAALQELVEFDEEFLRQLSALSADSLDYLEALKIAGAELDSKAYRALARVAGF